MKQQNLKCVPHSQKLDCTSYYAKASLIRF